MPKINKESNQDPEGSYDSLPPIILSKLLALDETVYYFPGFTDIERSIRLDIKRGEVSVTQEQTQEIERQIEEKRQPAAGREIENALQAMESGTINWISFEAYISNILKRLPVAQIDMAGDEWEEIQERIKKSEQQAALNSLLYYVQRFREAVNSDNQTIIRSYYPSYQLVIEKFPNLEQKVGASLILMKRVKALL